MFIGLYSELITTLQNYHNLCTKSYKLNKCFTLCQNYHLEFNAYASYCCVFAMQAPSCSVHVWYLVLQSSFSFTSTAILSTNWRASTSTFRKCFSHSSFLSASLATRSSHFESNTIRSSACFTRALEFFSFMFSSYMHKTLTLHHR